MAAICVPAAPQCGSGRVYQESKAGGSAAKPYPTPSRPITLFLAKFSYQLVSDEAQPPTKIANSSSPKFTNGPGSR